MTIAPLSPLERAAWMAAIDKLTPQPPVDVFDLLEYDPTPRQQVFHDATEFDVLFGGAAGGGKTKALVADDLRDAILYPGIRIGAFRRTYGELKESLLAELAQFGFAGALGARWNGTEYELRFPNGSLIMYRYAESVADATRRQGGQYQKLTFDERNLTSPDVIRFLESRLRSGRKDIPVLGIRSGTNPGGVGHGASRDRYIDATHYGEQVVTDIRGRTVRFIPSKLSDNPHVNPEYAMDLMALPDAMRAAFLDGNWDAFAGAMFPELKRERHVVEPIELPRSWKRYNGVDWGFTAPWAVLWAAVDEDGRVWFYREIYERKVGEAEQARRIAGAEADGERVSVRFADDAMWATRGEAKPIATVYADNGVHLTKAGKGAGSRVHGWQRWHSYLAEAPACPHHRAQGWETCPKVHMFSTCPELFKEMRDLPHAVIGDPEDADSRAPDHACLIAGTLVTTRRGAVPIERVTSLDSVLTRRGWRRVMAAGLTGRNRLVRTLRLADKTELTGTSDHPIWVEGRGWIRLDAVRYADRIAVWRNRSPSPLTAPFFAGIRTLDGGPTASTSPPAVPTVAEACSDSIRRSGRPPTVRFRRGIMSITRTRTRSTTASTTLPASLAKAITPVTPSRESASSLSGLQRSTAKRWQRLRSGIAAMRGVSGIESTPPVKASGIPKREPSNASSAGRLRRLGRRTTSTGSARTTASRNGVAAPGWMTRIGYVPPATNHSGSTATPRSGAALVSALGSSDAGRTDVYNLTVEGEPEFYANGVLVHNCDAGRYLLMNLDATSTADLFPPLRWRYWTPGDGGRINCGGRFWPLSQTSRFGTAYLPHGEDASSDYAVVCAWSRTLDGDLVLLDRVRSRMFNAPLAELLGPLARKYELDTVFVAKKQATDSVRKDARKMRVHLSPVDVDSDRVTRALPAAEKLGKIWLPADTAWTREVVTECSAFPATQTAGHVETIALAAHTSATRWLPIPANPATAPSDDSREIDYLTCPM